MSSVIQSIDISQLPLVEDTAVSIDSLPLVPSAPTGIVVVDSKGNGAIDADNTVLINTATTSEATSVREFVESNDTYAQFGDMDQRMSIIEDALVVAPQWKDASHYTSKIQAAAKRVK